MKSVRTGRQWIAAAVGTLVALALTACAHESSTAAQTLTVSYVVLGNPTTVEVEIDELRCDDAEGLRTFVGGDEVDGRAPVTVAILGGQASVAVRIDGDLWFVADGVVESDAGIVTFSDFTGSAVEQSADLTITDVVDAQATISGELSCA